VRPRSSSRRPNSARGEGERAVRADHELRAGPRRERGVAQRRVGDGRGVRAGRRVLGVGQGEGPEATVGGREPAEDAAPQVEGTEQPGVRDEHLRPPQEERAVVAQREVHPAEDPRLRLRVEVHEDVAAGEQVDARDGRVVHEIVAPEDHVPAQVAPERHAVVGPLEEALGELGGHVLGRLEGIGPEARLVERLLVDVRRVDLDPGQELLLAERLGQQHGQRVGLLARGAARRPDPDPRVGGPGRDQGGDRRLAEVAPGGGVAQEPRDVDEQRVEERGELVRVDLEEVEVVAVVGDPHRVHPLGHAPPEGRALVTREIEAPLLPHVVQHRLEAGLAHGIASPPTTSSRMTLACCSDSAAAAANRWAPTGPRAPMLVAIRRISPARSSR